MGEPEGHRLAGGVTFSHVVINGRQIDIRKSNSMYLGVFCVIGFYMSLLGEPYSAVQKRIRAK